MSGLLSFLRELDARGIFYTLGHHRDETVMVKVSVPGEHWEVEFFEDGEVHVEIFRLAESLGVEGLGRLLAEDDEAEAKARSAQG